MATQAATLRAILETVADTGDSASCSLDESLSLSGFTASTRKRVVLPNAAVDNATLVAWTSDIVGILVYSHDYAFSARLGAAETQMQNGRLFAFWGDDEQTAALAAGALLLSGNGANDSNLEVFLFEKA